MPAVANPVYVSDLAGQVVAREPATGPHPFTGESTTYKTVDKLLLESGQELYVCRKCGWCAEKLRSVTAHQSKKHHRQLQGRRAGRYPVAVIKTVLRAALAAKMEPGPDFARRAAKALNERGLTTTAGLPWDGDSVSRICVRYSRVYPVRVLGRPKGGSTEPVKTEAKPTSKPAEPRPARRRPGTEGLALLGEINAMVITLRHLVASAEQLLVRVEAGEWDHALPDPTVLDKAQRWDQLQKALGVVLPREHTAMNGHSPS